MQPSPPGTITSWAGAIVDIPANWFLCDGTNGTPDLRDKFVPGAGTTYAPADTGGNAVHQHNFTSNGHTHELLAGTNIQGFPGTMSNVLPANVLTGTSGNNSTILPYYALAFIMYGGN